MIAYYITFISGNYIGWDYIWWNIFKCNIFVFGVILLQYLFIVTLEAIKLVFLYAIPILSIAPVHYIFFCKW